MKIVHRVPDTELHSLPDWNLDPVLTRILWSRGVKNPSEAVYDLNRILSPSLHGMSEAVNILADAVVSQNKIMIVGDYDADGATSTALAMRFFRDINYGDVSFEIPSRQDDGYGLNRSIVLAAAESKVNVIVTVDNGISANEAVSLAVSLGIKVVITDHHIPGDIIPDAQAIVNPHLQTCTFPSKNLAGVGVIFYVVASLRSELNKRGYFSERNLTVPVVSNYLDFVALGTIADMVPMDYNNRLMADYGIRLIRAGRTTRGLMELIRICGLNCQNFKATDIVFSLCPRINAAGRIADMSYGVKCLLAEREDDAKVGAGLLQSFNVDRRNIEADMMNTALTQIRLEYDGNLPGALVLYNSSFNIGVMGIVAAKIKDLTGLTTVIMADSPNDELLVGSVRAVDGYHVCDALKRINQEHPEIFKAFGGHKGAAGLTIRREYLNFFKEQFILDSNRYSSERTDEVIVTDGELPSGYFISDFARVLVFDQPWGAEFSSPLFDGVFQLISQYVVGEKHLNVRLRMADGTVVSGMYYNHDVKVWPNYSVKKVRAVYGFDIQKNSSEAGVRVIIRNMEPA